MKENSIIAKIKIFFKNMFHPQKQLPVAVIKEEKMKNHATKLGKEKFFELYETLKKGEVDIFSIDPDELEKMCMLLEEEIQLKEKRVEEKQQKIAQMEVRIQELKKAI